MNMTELIQELKEKIIETLNLEELTPDDLDAGSALFGEGLGLDSIDALELIVLLEKNYGIAWPTHQKGKPSFRASAPSQNM